jgi:N-acetylmuramoyl-L-alanine amidase
MHASTVFHHFRQPTWFAPAGRVGHFWGWCLWLTVTGAFAAAPNAPSGRDVSALDRVRVFGQEYVRLSDWARMFHFEVRPVAGTKNLLVTNRVHRIEFTVDSREAAFNGIKFWLSAPIAAGRGSTFVSWLDLKTVIHPLVYPQKSAQPLRVICLDAGHGGHDPGNQAGRHQEKKYTLLLAKALKDRLQRLGYRVVLTRSGDSYLSYLERVDFAKRRGADLLVSLHYNSTRPGSRDARGIEVFCMTPVGAQSTNARGIDPETHSMPGNRQDDRNVFLAYHLQRALVRGQGREDRGVRRARFAVLRLAEIPAALVEGGFMSDPAEAKQIFDQRERLKMADQIATGIANYQRAVHPSAQVAPTPAPQKGPARAPSAKPRATNEVTVSPPTNAPVKPVP